MGLFEHWPYTNFHDLNLDWIIKKIKNVETAEANTAEYAEAAAESAAASQRSAEASQQSAENSQQSAEASQQSADNSAQSALEARTTVADTNSQIALLQSRVDNIIPAGTQTEGNTELLDIRVAFNGQAYTSAGDAVRAQDSYSLSLGDNTVKDFLGVEPIRMSKQYVYINTAGSVVDIESPNTSTRTWRYAVVACSPGDEFTINATGGNAPRGWCFIDTDGVPLSRARQNVASVMEHITAPANTAYLVINDEADNTSYKGNAVKVSDQINEVYTTLDQNYLNFTKEVTTPFNQIKRYDLLAMNYVHAASSLTFMGDRLLMFTPSNDQHTTYAFLGIFRYNFDTLELTLERSIRHNFGHANTVDYCEKNDTLVLGNGGGSGNTEPDQIYIIEDFSDKLSTVSDNGNMNLYNVAKIIDLDDLGLDWGKQVNVCWAGGNSGAYDQVIAFSNDGTTQTFRLLQLGKGSNDLGTGTLLTVGANEFNGTFKVLSTWSRAYNTSIANNDTQLYGGVLYEISGHTGIHVSKDEFIEDGTMISRRQRNKVYDSAGTEMYYINEGIAIKKDIMFTTGYVKPDNYIKLEILAIKL